MGIRELRIVEVNPVASVSKPPEGHHGTGFLSADERRALLLPCKTSASRDLYLAVLVALSTGLRRGELYGLRWRDIDLDPRWAVLPKTKNGDPRGIPLTEKVVVLLRLRQGASEARVFEKDLTKAWVNALRRAVVSAFRWHDLRHSCDVQFQIDALLECRKIALNIRVVRVTVVGSSENLSSRVSASRRCDVPTRCSIT